MKNSQYGIWVACLIVLVSCSNRTVISANQAYDCEPSAQIRADMLRLVNQARAVPRKCGWKRYDAAPPVVWNNQLAALARQHSDDMASRDFFSHRGTDGKQVNSRATAIGYRWQNIAENIYAGAINSATANAGWIKSAGHCENLMNPAYREMGVACSKNAGTAYVTFHTQVFGARR